MKRGEIVLAGIADAVPVACGMIASVCAAMTAYQIGFSLVPLITFCVFSALLLSFWMNVPRYGFGFGALFLTCVIMLCAFRMQRIGEGAVTCVYRLLDTMPESLKKLFDMEALANTAAQIEDPESALTLFLMVIAAVNGVILAFSLIRSKTVLLPLLIPLPMLLASLVYTNLQPAIWTMLLTCVYFGYALLGNGLRKGETPGRGALFVCLAPALLALGLILLAIFPQKNFDPVPADARRNWLADRISPITDTVMSWVGVRNPKNVDLANTGDRENDDTELFTVYARQGTYLLRTHSYGAYKNSRWRAAQRYGGEWDSMKALGDRQGTADGVMWVLNAMSNERIAPYAWTDEPVSSDPDEQTGIPQAEEYFIRSGGWRDYGWRYASRYATKPKNVTEAERRYYTDFAMKQYVMPDGEEKQALLAIAKRAGIKKSDDALKTANAVAAFVRDSGVYTLTPGKMPKGKDCAVFSDGKSRGLLRPFRERDDGAFAGAGLSGAVHGRLLCGSSGGDEPCGNACDTKRGACVDGGLCPRCRLGSDREHAGPRERPRAGNGRGKSAGYGNRFADAAAAGDADDGADDGADTRTDARLRDGGTDRSAFDAGADKRARTACGTDAETERSRAKHGNRRRSDAEREKARRRMVDSDPARAACLDRRRHCRAEAQGSAIPRRERAAFDPGHGAVSQKARTLRNPGGPGRGGMGAGGGVLES